MQNLSKMRSEIRINYKLWWLSCTIFQLLSSWVWAQETKPIDQYLEISAENNPQLKATFNQYLAALEEISQTGTLPDPQLMFGYFIQPVETRVGAQKFNFSISQMFPWFGTLSAQERVAAEKTEAKLQSFEDEKLALFRQVKITYNDLYYLQKAIEITQENLELFASFKELARVNFESGNAGFTDVLRVEMEEQELQNKLQALEEKRAPVLTRFEQLLNVDLQEAVALPDTLWQEQLLLQKSDIFQTILAENPRLEKLKHEIQSYEKQGEVAQKMGLPSLSVGMSYTNIAARTDMEMPDNGKDALLFPQVGVRLPLYRNKYEAMEKQAQLQREAAALSQESLEDQLLTELEQLYANYQNAQREVTLNHNLADLAERTLDLLQTEFSTGEAEFEEIIQVERQLLNYRLAQEKSRTELNNYVYSIHYLMGQ